MSHPSSTDQPDTIAEVILGLDTHKDVHVAATVSIDGVLLDSRSFTTTAEGYQAMLNWKLHSGQSGEPGWEGPTPPAAR